MDKLSDDELFMVLSNLITQKHTIAFLSVCKRWKSLIEKNKNFLPPILILKKQGFPNWIWDLYLTSKTPVILLVRHITNVEYLKKIKNYSTLRFSNEFEIDSKTFSIFKDSKINKLVYNKFSETVKADHHDIKTVIGTIDSKEDISFYKSLPPTIENLTISIVNHHRQVFRKIIDLTQLKTFSCILQYKPSNMIDTIIDADIVNFKNTDVERLTINYCNFTDQGFSVLKDKKIVTLGLHFTPYNNVSDMTWKSLEYLNGNCLKTLELNNIPSNGYGLLNFNNIECLIVDKCKVSDNTLQNINHLKKLKILTIKDFKNDLTDKGFSYLKDMNIEEFKFINHHNKLTDEMFQYMAKWPLKKLIIYSPGIITDKSIKQLSHHKLDLLEINDFNNISSDGIATLHKMSLKRLEIFCPINLTDDVLKSILKIEKLKELVIVSCDKITDNAFIDLCECKNSNIENIMINGCKISDKAIKYISNLKHLKSISLSNINALTLKTISILNSIDSLKRISIHSCNNIKKEHKHMFRLETVSLR